MFTNKYFGSYYPIESKIHDLNVFIKLFSLILLLIPLIGSMNIKLHVVMFFFIIYLLYESKVPLRFYFDMLYGLRYIFIVIIFMLASRGLILETALTILLKIFILIEYLSLLFYTTSPSELKYGIEKLLSPFNLISLDLEWLSNILVNTITFFPLLFTTERSVLLCAGSKGLDYYNQDILSKIVVALSSFKNTFRLTKEKIEKINLASSLRRTNTKISRTNLRSYKIGLYDILVLLVFLFFTAFYIQTRGTL